MLVWGGTFFSLLTNTLTTMMKIWTHAKRVLLFFQRSRFRLHDGKEKQQCLAKGNRGAPEMHRKVLQGTAQVLKTRVCNICASNFLKTCIVAVLLHGLCVFGIRDNTMSQLLLIKPKGKIKIAEATCNSHRNNS